MFILIEHFLNLFRNRERLLLAPKYHRLEFEYVCLPVRDLSFRFLYRYKSPVAMIWQEGSISHWANEANLREFALAQWHSLVTQGGTRLVGGTPAEDREIKELLRIEAISIHECHIVRKDGHV